jgi:hypothetical protein
MTVQAGIPDQVHGPLGARRGPAPDDARPGRSRSSRVPSRRALGAALRSPAILLRVVVLAGLGSLLLSWSLDLMVLVSA